MKKYMVVLLLAALCLLGACANLTNAAMQQPVPAPVQPPAAEDRAEPIYQFDTTSAQEWFTAEDGKELAHYSYQLLTMSVSNPDELSPADAEAAQRNMEAFNGRMASLMEESVAQGRVMGEDAQEAYQVGSAALDYYDETAAACYQAGRIISVRLDTDSFTGGAHPNSYTSSFLFDLGVGQFIDATQIAEDPEAFRTGAAELLLEQAEGLEARSSFWPEYADIIAHWNEGTVLFDREGMVVVFSHYVLGPYTMGTVVLRLDYDVLADLVGTAGMERLGVESTPRQEAGAAYAAPAFRLPKGPIKESAPAGANTLKAAKPPGFHTGRLSARIAGRPAKIAARLQHRACAAFTG